MCVKNNKEIQIECTKFCYHIYQYALGFSAEGVFLPFFGFFFHTDVEYFKKGGAAMDEDNDVFEMFLVMMEQLQTQIQSRPYADAE